MGFPKGTLPGRLVAFPVPSDAEYVDTAGTVRAVTEYKTVSFTKEDACRHDVNRGDDDLSKITHRDRSSRQDL